MINSIGIDLLVTPFFAFGIGILFICSGVFFVARRKKLSRAQKIAIGIIMLICLSYLAFIVWLTVSFGSNHPPSNPVPSKVIP